MSVKTFGRVLSSFLRWLANDDYCLTTAVVATQAGQTLDGYDITGAFVIDDGAGGYQFAKAADAASIDGVILTREPTKLTLAAATNTTEKYTILVRGPAVLLKTGLATADPAAAAITMATAITALATKNILVRTEAGLTQA